jgi:hypothetical protein
MWYNMPKQERLKSWKLKMADRLLNPDALALEKLKARSKNG